MEATRFDEVLKKANEGFLFAMYSVGECYWYGLDVDADKEKAFSWFLKSAQNGCALSYDVVAWCYQEGCGVVKNEAEAIKWDPTIVANRPCPLD